MKAEIAGVLRFCRLIILLGPWRRLRQADSLQLDLGCSRNQLIECVPAEDLVNAIRVLCDWRRDQNRIRRRVQLKVLVWMSKRVMSYEGCDMRQLCRLRLQEFSSRWSVEEEVSNGNR